ncbi:MAG: aldehyde dehydrogenase [Candidatus Omnitrophica bacterium]|jgi:acyl-CoA reductase-like NAD-dependent aldehyde dehydrogenase|nr:aldehyde dehydrogenase [Candidatus Omnitrophota bacterium]
MFPHYPLFINGEFKNSRLKEDVINPASGEPIASVSLAGQEEIEQALEAARLAYDQGPWSKISLTQRKEFILKIAQGILDAAAELAKLETLNNGKPIKESTFMDIPSAAESFKYFANNLERFLKEEIRLIESPITTAKSYLVPQSQGVVVLIVPWNYPLLIASWKMAQALAAGNTVILKPSSLTPLTALELSKIIAAAGFPKGVVNILAGRGEDIGKTLCSDERVDMISFTGSNSVGKKIIEYTSQNVKKLIMELGGKSASLILADCDIETAVNGSLCSIFLNQGQMCTAMSRIFVEDKIYDIFIKDFLEKLRRIKLGEGINFETQMGPLISKEQLQTVINFVEQAKREGAQLLYGGKKPDQAALKKGFFFEPTVFTDVDSKMPIFRKEIFGPVVCIGKFSSLDQAVQLANDSDFGLAACIWTGNKDIAQELGRRINAGTIWINTYGMFFNEVPYGGFKQSGIGKELGKEGFWEYLKLKNIIFEETKDTKPLINYWYGF